MGARDPVDLTVTAETFSGGLRTFLHGNAFAAAIPHVIDRARRGDLEPFATRAITFAEALARTLHLGLYLSVVCTEDLPFVEMREARAAAEGTFMGDALVRNHLRAGDGWPRGELPPRYRRPARSEIPTLLISGAADPVTGSRRGEEAVRHLPNSRHLVIGHAGHSDAVGPCEG